MGVRRDTPQGEGINGAELPVAQVRTLPNYLPGHVLPQTVAMAEELAEVEA